VIDGQRTDFCRCAAYTFLDARSSQPRLVEEIRTDGSVALLQSEVGGRRDVVMVGARQLDLGSDEYRLSERGDVRFRHVGAHELEIVVMDTETGKPLQVSWPAFSAPWKSGNLEVLELEGDCWIRSRNPVPQTRTGPQLARLLPGARYRVVAPSR
jgi:hypothetical protein